MKETVPFLVPAAITYANWSKLAYSGPIPNTVKYEWVTNDKANIHCLVIYQTDKTIFAFRGTTNLAEWLIDGRIKFKKLNNGTRIHTGFYDTVDSIWLKLSSIATKSTVPVHITGHSKGGGEAIIFALRLVLEQRIYPQLVMTFGSPRVFNRIAANLYNDFQIPTFRVIDKEDMVARIPWFDSGEFYWHVDINVFLDSYNNAIIGRPWYARLKSDVHGIVREGLRGEKEPVIDHFIDKYLARLQQQLI